MSFDIDMKNFAGAPSDSAAGNQQIVDTNSYQQDASEYPVQTDLLDKPSQPETPVEQAPDRQELNFRALTQEVDRMKAEREAEKREYQLQIDMLKANISEKQQPPQQERRFLDGMKEDDIPNVGEIRREWEAKEAAYQARLEEMSVAQQYPDYAEVLQKYVVPLVKNKPHLAEGIRGASNKALMAYELGKMAQQMQERQQVEQKSETAQRMVENSRKPGTLSQAGGQGALSKADFYASMSDQEFMRMAGKHLDGI